MPVGILVVNVLYKATGSTMSDDAFASRALYLNKHTPTARKRYCATGMFDHCIEGRVERNGQNEVRSTWYSFVSRIESFDARSLGMVNCVVFSDTVRSCDADSSV